MQKRKINLSWILIFLSVILHAQELTFTSAQMRADLEYMNRYLRKWHPAYYTYTPKAEMDAFYQKLSDSCNSTATLSQFRTMLRQAVNKVGCGHMNVSSPKNNKTTMLVELIPLETWITGKQLYVSKYLGEGGLLSPGDEILSINGIAAADILERASEMVFTDGYNTTLKINRLEQIFPYIYYFVFGPTAVFQVKYKSPEEITATVEFGSVPKSNKAEIFPGPAVDSSKILIKGDGLALYSMDTINHAVLIDIDRFEGEKHRQSYRQMFRYLRLNDIDHLVIDLRNNGGGSAFYGGNFLAYLLKPTVRGMNISRKPNLIGFNPKFKTGFMYRNWPLLFTLNPLQYPGKGGWHHFIPFIKKGRNHFDGRVYVLANGGTYSMASYTSSYLKHKRGAVIIGEETGGGEVGSRGILKGDIELPNTGMRISLMIYNVHINLKIEDTGKGVMPDYPVKYSIEDRLQQKDLEMEQVRKLILNEQKSMTASTLKD